MSSQEHLSKYSNINSGFNRAILFESFILSSMTFSQKMYSFKF